MEKMVFSAVYVLVWLMLIVHIRAFRMTNGVRRKPVFPSSRLLSTGEDEINLSQQERKELWKAVSGMERQAIQGLSSRSSTEEERDEAWKLLALSVGMKNSDPFIKLSQQYAKAVRLGDQIDMARIFEAIKLAGLPPHIDNIVNQQPPPERTSSTTSSSITLENERVEMEDVDPGSMFSDTVTEKIRVKIFSFYDKQKSEPQQGKFLFWYKVAIFNEGTEPVQVIARMWEIEKCRGEKEVVQGAGVIGTQPIIPPGEVFTYKSACPLKVFPPRGKRIIGSMSGTYTLCKGNMGQHNFTVKVSKFNFILPSEVASQL